MEEKLLINEVASLLNIEPSAIRYWESKGLLHLQRDNVNGYRYFDLKALIEILDIIFFRKMQLPIKVLSQHLSGTIDERKRILSNTKEEVDTLLVSLTEAHHALDFRLNCIDQITQLKNTDDIFIQKDVDFLKVESLNLSNEGHTKKYLTDPSHFTLLFNDKDQTIREGILSYEKEEAEDYTIWKKSDFQEVIFGGLLMVNVENYKVNTLDKLKIQNSISSEYNQAIAQYLSSGKEQGTPVDYYKCWFFKE